MNRTMIQYDKNGKEMTIPVRSAQSVETPSARYTGFKQEKLLLKKGSIRLKGYMPLPCDIVLERDVPVKLRDGTTIYTDVFRPADEEEHPAILALSPYGKEIGTQWLDDTPNHAGIPMEATSGLQKFEGPDPAYWCNHGYAIINPDVRGAYNSEGVILFFGSDYGRDGADLIDSQAQATKRMQEGYTYQQERSFDVAQDAARNEAAGQFSNMGIGLGMMAGVGGTVGGMVGGVVSDAFAGMSAVQPQTAANKFCDQCGAELTPGAAFCDECGAPQAPSDTCAKCGFKFIKPGKFCPKCGTKREG